MAIEASISFYKGEAILLTVTITPVTNITGWSITFTLRDKYTGAVLLTKSVGTGVTITDGPGGVFTVLLTKANTSIGQALASNRTPVEALFDIRRTDTGSEAALTVGDVEISPGS